MRTPQRLAARALLLAVTLFAVARPAAAQRSWDITAGTGGWWGRPADTAPAGAQISGQEGFFSWLGTIGVGRYWTPHIKIEADASFAGGGDSYVLGFVQPPGARQAQAFVFEQQHRELSIAALATLQAGRNWWVHPFLQGGVSFDWDHVEPEEFFGFSSPAPPLVNAPSETRQVTRAVVGGGAKFYLNERAFFRSDLRTSFGGGATHVQIRAGFGVDF